MRYKYILLLIIPVLIFSCKKEKETIYPPAPVAPAPTVLLKEIVIPNLPSPYYEFKYLSTGKMIFASFASGFTMYDLVYTGDRMSVMQNVTAGNHDGLQYFYDNAGNIRVVSYTDPAGLVYTTINLTYVGKQLVKLERGRKSGAGFIIDKTITFDYYADGNLRDLTEHFLAFNGQNDFTATDSFEGYDNKINVDGFSLLHDEFFDHLVLLPGVQLQKNNPGKLIHTGDGSNYKIAYTYTYNDRNAPLTKTGEGLWLNGPNAGVAFQSHILFSYY